MTALTQSVRTAVNTYLTGKMQEQAPKVSQSGSFTQTMRYVKVVTPKSCGTDSSVTASQNVDGLVNNMAAVLPTGVATRQRTTPCLQRISTARKWPAPCCRT